MAASQTFPGCTTASWRELVLPKEHGSWSLAFEPVALGLLVAPSRAGALLALAVAAAFFARRPLGIAARDHRPGRRAAARAVVAALAAIAAVCFLAALALAGGAWSLWLLPSAIAGAVFLGFDLRNDGRAEAAEVAGAATFAFLPAAFAALAGESPRTALALGLVMAGRAVPTVLCVRAFLRDAKTGVPRPGLAIATAMVAVAGGAALARTGLAPWGAVALLGLLASRTLALLVVLRPALRARTLGMIEAVVGIVFVLALAALWHR